MSENNDASNESNSLSSDGIIQSTRLVSSNPLIRTGVLRPSVLGHSVLGAAAAAAGTTATENSLSSKPDAADTNNSIFANNPFLKESNDDEEDSVSGAEGGDSLDKSAESASSSNNKPAAAAGSGAKAKTMTTPADDEEVDDRPDPLTLLRRNGIERSNIFAAAKNSIPLVEKSGFVFGQNVHERVVGENINTEKSTNADANAAGGGASASSSSTSEMLFSDVIQNARAAEIAAETAAAAEGGGAGADGAAASNDLSKETETKSLSQVAKEYEESRAQKRKYEEVETFTGEENEVNIIDINCKLFAFVNSNWEERGRGSLRLNDSKIEGECSRVVFRTAGNLRLLLNTKVWAGMVAERPSLKSLRLTAMDQTGVIKIFLVMARPAEIKELHMSLVYRIDKRKLNHPEEFRRSDSQNNGDGAAAEGAADDANGLNNGAVGETEESHAKSSTIAAESEPDDNGEPSPKKAVSTSAADEASN